MLQESHQPPRKVHAFVEKRQDPTLTPLIALAGPGANNFMGGEGFLLSIFQLDRQTVD